MKPFLTTLHRWLGFPLGLLFVIIFGTGCITAVDELLERAQQTHFASDYSYRSTSVEENANAVASLIQEKNGIRQVLLPSPTTPYYQVIGRGERWVSPIDQLEEEKYFATQKEGFFSTVLQLHRNFLLGKEGLWGIEGAHYAAWVGLIALFLSVLGLWLWWPLKKTFKTKDVIPRGVKRKHFYYSHMTSGVVVLFVIVLLSLTGASITYRSVAQQLFGVERNKAASTEAITLDNNWLAWINAAYAHMPEGARLDRIQFPRQPKQNAKRAPYNEETAAINRREKNQQQANKQDSPEIIELRFHAPGDWLGLGGNAVKIDKKSSQLVDVIRFADLPLGEKIYSLLKPLHTGHHLPVAYVFVLLILSLIGTAMVLSGLLSFLLKKRKPSNVTQLLSKILRASKLRAVNSIQ